MRLVLISDTHTKHNQLNLPDGDLLIHAGDYTFTGRPDERIRFYTWFGQQKHKHKVYIAGNHDFGEPTEPLDNGVGGHYLYESGIEIEGLRLWGSPYTPRFGDWAFMYDRPTNRWLDIPSDTDVLITHGPPLGFLDKTQPQYGGESVGCFDLRQRVLEVKPKLHVFGHIHGMYGQEELNGTRFVNASSCNESYQIANVPIVIDL